MYVLGIETSCDETSASVVKDGKIVLSNIVNSSLNWHKKYGGIIPEIASRCQLETIVQVTDKALEESKLSLKKIGLIGVTREPGLMGSLLVGVSFAKAMSCAARIPLIEVDHLYGHIYAAFLENKLSFPIVALIVSGGHTSLFYIKGFANIKLLGSTLDDACGEAFDKVAKILDLGYPGGPVIERVAKTGKLDQKLNCCDTKKPLDFSFSGIKTAVLYRVRNQKKYLTQSEKANIAFAFQESVVNAITKKAILACRLKRTTTLVVGGGVAANQALRNHLEYEALKNGIRVYFPAKALCMDNAAMIAGLSYQLFRKNKTGGQSWA